jgi:cytochrome c556
MLRRLLAVLMLVCSAPSAAPTPQPAEIIAYRQSLFRVIRWNVGYLVEMASGRAEWNAADFARRAARVAALSRQLDEAFVPGSDSGALTDAKPEIWTDPEDFAGRLRDFQAQARALARVARGDDIDAAKAEFGKTMRTCKACHDRYRAE